MSNKDKFNQCQKYILFDDPIPFVTETQQLIYIYPCLMKDALSFYSCIDVLLQEKDNGNHKGFTPQQILKMLKMSYLDYIVFINNDKTNMYLYKLKVILMICFQINENEITFYQDNINYSVIIKIKDIELKSIDFDAIHKIICLQNNVELPDEDIHPDMKKILEEARKFANNQAQSGKPGNLDDQIVCVQIAMQECDKQKIKQLTIRSFNKILQRYNHKLHYQILKTAELSGNVEFKKPIESWLNNLDKTGLEKYSDVLIDTDDIKDTVNEANGKHKQKQNELGNKK